MLNGGVAEPKITGGLTGRGGSVNVYNVKMVNTTRLGHRPLTPLEQVLMDYVWAHPDCTAEACREGLATQRSIKDSTVRTILRKLEEKGYVTHKVDGRTFVYKAVETKRSVAARAVRQLIDRFCGGSVEELLVGLVDSRVLAPKQLRRLAEEIASRRETKK